MLEVTLTVQMSPSALAHLAHERAERFCVAAALANDRATSLDLKERAANWYDRQAALLAKAEASASSDNWGIAA